MKNISVSVHCTLIPTFVLPCPESQLSIYYTFALKFIKNTMNSREKMLNYIATKH